MSVTVPSPAPVPPLYQLVVNRGDGLTPKLLVAISDEEFGQILNTAKEDSNTTEIVIYKLDHTLTPETHWMTTLPTTPTQDTPCAPHT